MLRESLAFYVYNMDSLCHYDHASLHPRPVACPRLLAHALSQYSTFLFPTIHLFAEGHIPVRAHWRWPPTTNAMEGLSHSTHVANLCIGFA